MSAIEGALPPNLVKNILIFVVGFAIGYLVCSHYYCS